MLDRTAPYEKNKERVIFNTLVHIQQELAAGTITCEDLVKQYLERIEANKQLNVFIEVYAGEALAKAKEIDQKLANGTAGKLAGMVLGLKDVICHKDHGLQSSSKILDKFESQFTASAVQKLLDEDVIVIGRQSCDEFAMGSSNEKSVYGPALNPHDNERVPGGSSGASASAVAANLCLASLGSDTGGSVRQPAAFCGIVGLKPTYSRISRYGLAAYASSFDTIGIISRSVEDAALLLELMAGKDEFDSTVSQKEVPAYSKQLDFNKKSKIAYLKSGLGEGVEEKVKENFLSSIEQLKADGHEVEEISFSLLDVLLPTYYILTTAEASSNLSRYDGVRYGHRSEEAVDVDSLFKKSRTEGFGEEVRKRIMLGTFVLSAGYFDAYYAKAQKVRRQIQEETVQLFDQYDYLILPTSASTAFKIGEHADSLSMYMTDLFTVQASLAGIPAISIPCGKDEKKLPIGLQVMAAPFEEANLLAFSNYLLNKNEALHAVIPA
ncbi:MAG: Asp-tRNA(Asn)/Glu-tRNA(Gln) amidotransferase subunit GatA [Cyclobacteriaceae bacterium]